MAKEIAEGITIDQKVLVGKPVIKGTRIPVELVLAKLSANPNVDDFFLDYPEITVDQIKACLHYATRLVQSSERSARGKAELESARPRA